MGGACEVRPVRVESAAYVRSKMATANVLASFPRNAHVGIVFSTVLASNFGLVPRSCGDGCGIELGPGVVRVVRWRRPGPGRWHAFVYWREGVRETRSRASAIDVATGAVRENNSRIFFYVQLGIGCLWNSDVLPRSRREMDRFFSKNSFNPVRAVTGRVQRAGGEVWVLFSCRQCPFGNNVRGVSRKRVRVYV